MLLSCSKISKSFGINDILNDISFSIDTNNKIGIIGTNGAGKSTLFKILMQEYKPDSGEIYKNKDIKITYMQQNTDNHSTNTAIEEVSKVFYNLSELEIQIKQLQNKIDKSPDTALIERLNELQTAYNENGGLTYKARTLSTLKGLGFSESNLNVPLCKLSGGQRTQVMLAKVLLSNADLLLLDEPTNHLDINAISWLESFLLSYNGAILLITHDRYFLDKVTNKIFEIEHHKLKEYNGNYSYYIQKKTADSEALQKDYSIKSKEIKRLEDIIVQQKKWNREKNIKTAENKQKMIDRIKDTMIKPEETLDTVKFRFNFQEECANDVLTVEGLSKSFNGNTLFSNLNLDIKKAEKVFILGENGSGKTTLFRILLEQINSDSGKFKFGPRVKVAYYDQTQSGLDLTKTIFDDVHDAHPHLDNTTIRTALAVFLFKGDDVFKIIGTLSGGEKARVCLVKLMLSKSNMLLLDEPTNHLDIMSKEALENALLQYDGTLLIISHDRYFINKLADKIYVLNKNGSKEYDGDYNDYLIDKQAPEQPQKTENTRSYNDYKNKKEIASTIRKLKTQINKCEQKIAELEEVVSKSNIELQDERNAADYEKILLLTNLISKSQNELDIEMETWTELSDKLETINGAN